MLLALMNFVLPAHAVELGGLEKTATVANIASGPTDPTTAVATIVTWVLSFVGVIFLILMIWGGFTWMTAAGNEEQIGKAQKVIISAAIGLIIVLSAYGITRFIGTQMGV